MYMQHRIIPLLFPDPLELTLLDIPTPGDGGTGVHPLFSYCMEFPLLLPPPNPYCVGTIISPSIFAICFALNNPTSYENIKSKWIPEVRHHMPDTSFILVGMKSDVQLQPSEHTIIPNYRQEAYGGFQEDTFVSSL